MNSDSLYFVRDKIVYRRYFTYKFLYLLVINPVSV